MNPPNKEELKSLYRLQNDKDFIVFLRLLEKSRVDNALSCINSGGEETVIYKGRGRELNDILAAIRYAENDLNQINAMEESKSDSQNGWT